MRILMRKTTQKLEYPLIPEKGRGHNELFGDFRASKHPLETFIVCNYYKNIFFKWRLCRKRKLLYIWPVSTNKSVWWKESPTQFISGIYLILWNNWLKGNPQMKFFLEFTSELSGSIFRNKTSITLLTVIFSFHLPFHSHKYNPNI